MTRKPDSQVVTDLLLDLSEKVARQAREPNIFGYKPHLKQKMFHQMDIYRRLYIGGNRSGKTYGSVAEDIWWATGTHPYINTPKPPIRGRVVAVDLLLGVQGIILPLFKQLCPPSKLKGGSWEKGYDNYTRILTFSNESTIEFMSYEMKVEKFAGTSRHFIHFDEEPPRAIFDECMARLVDTEGYAWISMTPVKGMTWLYDSIYKPTLEAENREILYSLPDHGEVYFNLENETGVIEVSTDENPYLSEKGKSRYFDNLDPASVEARKKGIFVQRSGMVFRNFDNKTHVIPDIPDPSTAFRDCLFYSSVDHGWNNPTAWLWHAVKPDGTVITFGEHYASHMTISEHAQIVHEKERAWGIKEIHRTGDPAMKQTSAITGTSISQEYADHGLYLELDSVPRDVATGLARMQQYMAIRSDGKPSWLITEACRNFISEMKSLHFKKYVSDKAENDNNPHEEIQKKDDHTFDSARYFATFLPDLAPDSGPKDKTPSPPSGGLDYDKALWKAFLDGQKSEEETQWTVLETY